MEPNKEMELNKKGANRNTTIQIRIGKGSGGAREPHDVLLRGR